MSPPRRTPATRRPPFTRSAGLPKDVPVDGFGTRSPTVNELSGAINQLSLMMDGYESRCMELRKELDLANRTTGALALKFLGRSGVVVIRTDTVEPELGVLITRHGEEAKVEVCTWEEAKARAKSAQEAGTHVEVSEGKKR